MPGLKIAFTLQSRDLTRLRAVLREAALASAHLEDAEMVEAAQKLASRVRASDPPDYVEERIGALETVAEMLRDADWTLPSSVRRRVRTALAYFSEPADMIPDHVPVLGYLDDAIMIELIRRELEHEIEGYRDFCRARRQISQRRSAAGGPSRGDRLHARRKQLRARIQARQVRDAERAGGRRFRLW